MLNNINFKYVKMFIAEYADLDFTGLLNYYITCSGVNSGSPEIYLNLIVDNYSFKTIYKQHADDIISRNNQEDSVIYTLAPGSSLIETLKKSREFGEINLKVPYNVFDINEVSNLILEKYGVTIVNAITSSLLDEDAAVCFSTNEQKSYYIFSTASSLKDKEVKSVLEAVGFKLIERLQLDSAQKLTFKDTEDRIIKIRLSNGNIQVSFKLN